MQFRFLFFIDVLCGRYSAYRTCRDKQCSGTNDYYRNIHGNNADPIQLERNAVQVITLPIQLYDFVFALYKPQGQSNRITEQHCLADDVASLIKIYGYNAAGSRSHAFKQAYIAPLFKNHHKQTRTGCGNRYQRHYYDDENDIGIQ